MALVLKLSPVGPKDTAWTYLQNLLSCLLSFCSSWSANLSQIGPEYRHCFLTFMPLLMYFAPSGMPSPWHNLSFSSVLMVLNAHPCYSPSHVLLWFFLFTFIEGICFIHLPNIPSPMNLKNCPSFTHCGSGVTPELCYNYGHVTQIQPIGISSQHRICGK